MNKDQTISKKRRGVLIAAADLYKTLRSPNRNCAKYRKHQYEIMGFELHVLIQFQLIKLLFFLGPQFVYSHLFELIYSSMPRSKEAHLVF